MRIEEMTYSEAKNYLLHCIDEAKSKDWADGIKFALVIVENAIEHEATLKRKIEQPFCEDAVSREEAIRIAEQGQIQGYEWQFKKLCNLPSVTSCEEREKGECPYYGG